MKVNDVLGEDTDVTNDAPLHVGAKPVHVGPYQVFSHLHANDIGMLRRIANGKIDIMDMDDDDPKMTVVHHLQNLHLVGISDVTELGQQCLYIADRTGGTGARTRDMRDASGKSAALRAANQAEDRGEKFTDVDVDMDGDEDFDDVDDDDDLDVAPVKAKAKRKVHDRRISGRVNSFGNDVRMDDDGDIAWD